jgi:hypothetical protein
MKNFLLMILATILLAIFGTLGFLYSFFTLHNGTRSKYYRAIAESLDQLGNVVCQDLFNQWMIRDVPVDGYWPHMAQAYSFGNIDETVSSVLGKNKRRGTLTPAGQWLDRLLDKMDKNHSIDSIEKNP